MVDTLQGLKPGNIIIAGDVIFKIAKMGPVRAKRKTISSRSGVVKYEQATVRSCPPGFEGGRLNVKDYGRYNIHRHIAGDLSQYAMLTGRWLLDLTCAAVGEGNWMPVYDVGDLTKMDLISYVIAVHGPSTRDDIMRRVAALESLPWIPTSNSEYFYSKHRYASTESTMCHAGKLGRKQLYDLRQVGMKLAKVALAKLGEGPAHAVK